MDGDIRDSDHDDFDARHIALQEALRTAAKAVLEDRPEGYAFELSPFAVVTACTPAESINAEAFAYTPAGNADESALVTAARTLLKLVNTAAGHIFLTDTMNLHFGSPRAIAQLGSDWQPL